MAVKLSELLDHTPFGLRLVTSTPTANRVVRGVSAIEWPEPGRWLAPGYLVMTNGMALRGSVEKQQRFVEDVHRAGAPALGLWIQATFKTAPAAMARRAGELGLPMFTAPYELPSREIISFVMRSALTDEDQSLSRAMTAQDYLLEALGEEEPVAALIARLHMVLRAAAVAFSPVGDVIAAAGTPPLHDMWSAICADQEVVPFERDWLYTAVGLVGDVPYAYLAVRLHGKPRPTTYAGSVVRFAARVLQMIGLTGHARAEQERASRVALLRDLLGAGMPERGLLERLHVLGFRPGAPVRVMLGDLAERSTAEEALGRLGAAFAWRHALTIFDVGPHGMIGLTEQDPAERETLAELVGGDGAVLESVGVGLGAPLEHGIQQTHREAQIARLRARRERSDIVWFDDMGLADQLLSYVPADRLGWAVEMLAPLRDQRPDLLHTLGAYLERDCSVIATANALHLHANSLRYRLSVIERVLGRSLSSLDTLVELTLAMRIDAVSNGHADVRDVEPVARPGS